MPRMLHLGLGAFHRAHQAVYLQRLHDAGDADWELAGGNLRGDLEAGLDQLRARQGAYTLETIDPAGGRRYQRITSIRQVIAWDPQLSGLVKLGAAPETRIISFTVTEGGYGLNPSGQLDADSAAVREALGAARRGDPGSSWHGALTCILRERMRQRAGPVTLLSCDNVRHNGERSRTALMQFLELLAEPALLEWTRSNTTSPNAMVDRITPRPTSDVAQRVHAATGVADPCALMSEAFIQWVIEEQFIAGRPAWEQAGVQMVASVEPYEEAKIRLLNASHSCIAWAGTLAGHQYIHEGARDERVRALAHTYATTGAIPLLPPSTLDLHGYRDSVLDRFGNAAILDTNQRVASDSFAKIPAFIAPSVRESLEKKRPLEPVAALAGLFTSFLQRWDDGRLPFAYQDQAMDSSAARAICRAQDPAAALARSEKLWGEASTSARWAEAVRNAHARVRNLFG